MENSWIKLHRRMLDWCWYKDNNVKCLFIHLLLKANFESGIFAGILINRGQRWTSVRNLSFETGLSQKEIRTALKKLQKGKEIDIQTASNGTMITICNYDEYQVNKKPRGKRRANEVNPEGQQYKKNNKEEEYSGWRTDFDIYIEYAKHGFRKTTDDAELISRLEEYHPRLNIKKSIEASYVKYWGTEDGWVNKKSNKQNTNIDWASTIMRTIEMNKVYKEKDD